MAETSKIEWCDSIDLNATGRVLGAYKTAAARTGCSVEEWMQRRTAGSRWCFRCRSWKERDAFTADVSRKGGRASTCKPCMSEASTASRYGLTPDELREFRKEHGEACGICKRGGELYVDHCHATGRVRGLLCPSCNTAIGLLGEDPERFAAALAYLGGRNG